MSTNYDAERFQSDTRDHEMTVLRDDGLYRHLRFKAPDTSFYWFDLITWPGYLAVVGDFGDGYTFTRVPDMFEFFRAKSGWNGGSINPMYWAEKIASGRDGVKRYSMDIFRRLIDEHVAYAVQQRPEL